MNPLNINLILGSLPYNTGMPLQFLTPAQRIAVAECELLVRGETSIVRFDQQPIVLWRVLSWAPRSSIDSELAIDIAKMLEHSGTLPGETSDGNSSHAWLRPSLLSIFIIWGALTVKAKLDILKLYALR